MGHCLSCFKHRANADVISVSTHGNKNEMTEIAASVPVIHQEEPLLHDNENNINNHINIGNVESSNNIHYFGDNQEEVINTPSKPVVMCEKVTKPFYQKLSTLGSNERISESKITQLFDQYKDSLEDAICTEGIENLCNDLQLEPDDFKVLLLAWKLNASQMCRFTKSEFIQGLKTMKTDSIIGIQHKLNEIINDLNKDSEQFKDLYRFTFKFGLDVNIGQRILPTDIAILLWRLVFTNNEPPILNRWLVYLEKNPHIRGIPKDTWYMFLNFCEFVGNDLSSYDDTEAWPSLFDDFVEYENDQMNQNITKSDKVIGLN